VFDEGYELSLRVSDATARIASLDDSLDSKPVFDLIVVSFCLFSKISTVF
jgi:hypothetical protein